MPKLLKHRNMREGDTLFSTKNPGPFLYKVKRKFNESLRVRCFTFDTPEALNINVSPAEDLSYPMFTKDYTQSAHFKKMSNTDTKRVIVGFEGLAQHTLLVLNVLADRFKVDPASSR